MKIATLNVCIFPIISQNIFKDDKIKRINFIIQQIIENNIEILCIQELFCKNMIKYIENHPVLLKNFYKLYYDNSYSFYNRSGLAILSKYEVRKQFFEKYNGYNCLSRVIRDPIIQIAILPNNIHILNIHAISAEYYPCRRKTFIKDNNQNRKDIEKVCRTIDNNKNTFILCGDFNNNNLYINDSKNIPYFMNENLGITLNQDSYLSPKNLHDINICDYIVSNRMITASKKIKTESDHFMIVSDFSI